MPLVEITMIEGRPPERVRALIHEVHEAVRRSLEAPPESIRVVVREVPPTHWAAGDVTIAERRAASGAASADGGGEGAGG
ncbi:tautomerase family protein [Thermopolyspora sp. NPDC052614]|uniref:tautomerase family protein n=1 Tax=Thermopolyspora sp. NPDC052614 TaxID=3155682 RepID=UPI00342FEE15